MPLKVEPIVIAVLGTIPTPPVKSPNIWPPDEWSYSCSVCCWLQADGARSQRSPPPCRHPGLPSRGTRQRVPPSRGAQLLAPASTSAVLPRTSNVCWRELLFIWQLEKDIKTNLLFTASWECNLLAIQSNVAPIYTGLLQRKLAILGL